jgi:hypothetical protein
MTKATSRKTNSPKTNSAKTHSAKTHNYTDPVLRERLKKKILAGDKGGDPGEWSARKAQLLTRAYEKAGGAYKNSKRTESQKSLQTWTEEDWTTSDGGPSQREGGKVRYLPKEAWENLSEAEKKQANASKRKGDRAGKQFVPNPEAAKDARKAAQEKKSVSKKRKPDAGRDPLTT